MLLKNLNFGSEVLASEKMRRFLEEHIVDSLRAIVDDSRVRLRDMEK
jgi:hypothetical protein